MTIAIEGLREQMEADYFHLHTHPELSMQEFETAKYIEARLDELGIEHFRCGGTGVVGIVKNGDGPTVGFRADTDALPILEESGLEWASTVTADLDGKTVPVMHGCGHDIHTSVGMATARYMVENKDAWAGTLVFIFQPAEETAAGSKAMVEDGIWDKAPKPEIMYGQHVMALPTGKVACSIGTAMSQADALKVTLKGRQAHGSMPQFSIDPIVLGSHIVTRLQSVVSRNVDPRDMAVLTVGTFNSGLKENIIPETAVLGLNVRTFKTEVRETVIEGIERTVKGECEASGATYTIEQLYDFPLNYNDPDEAVKVMDVLRAELGDENVLDQPALSGSEDFGRFAQVIGVPSVFWLFGGFSEDFYADGKTAPPNHSPQFAPTYGPSLETGTRAAVAVLLARVGK
ncbi:MAG: amidohydrolase [Dermatophilus congolensis]|nr:amidohydrolase [Dermatophilus congolensis]